MVDCLSDKFVLKRRYEMREMVMMKNKKYEKANAGKASLMPEGAKEKMTGSYAFESWDRNGLFGC